jgi:hypothetical protein
MCTDKKERKIFLIYKEIQEIQRCLFIYGEKFAHFLIYWELLPHI